MKKISFTGKMMSEHNSSFVEFEIEENSKEAVANLEDMDRKSCSESIWVGDKSRGGNFERGSILIGYDYCERTDFNLLKENLDSESYEMIKETSENY